MSQVTDPVLLDSTGRNIVTGISAVVSAIQSRGMPSPSASNPQMDGTASPGTSNDYARGDHVHPSDTSKANQTQLAYVESGTTASRAYAVGEYFCLNGLLYRAKTAISSGASFTPGTNCEQVAEGAANSLKSEFDYKVKTTPTVYDATRLSSVSGGYVVKGNVVYIQMQFTVNGSWSIPSLDTFRLFSNFPAPQFGALCIASGNGNNALWNFNFLVRDDGAGVLFNRDAATHNVNGVTFTVTGSYIIA